jgi:hypothetical protein
VDWGIPHILLASTALLLKVDILWVVIAGIFLSAALLDSILLSDGWSG